MNFKFLRQALGLVIGLCASINIVQGMENSEIIGSTNKVSQEEKDIITKLQNINLTEEKALLEQVNQNEDYNYLIKLCEKEFNYNSSPEKIVNFIIKSVEYIRKTASLHDKLCDAICTSIGRKCDVRDIRDEIKSSSKNNEIIQELIKNKFKEADDILGKVLMKSYKHSELKGKIKDLKKQVEYMGNIDQKLIDNMNNAMDSIFEEK